MIDIRQQFPGLVEALIKVESSSPAYPDGNDNAIGDTKLANRAYGCLQIRKPYVDDVNRIYGKHYSSGMCLGNRELSIQMLNMYMGIYATQRQLGHVPTAEDIARIHNGGPAGWKNPDTVGYWCEVQAHMNAQSAR